MIGDGLNYIAIAVDDAVAMARRFADVFELPVVNTPDGGDGEPLSLVTVGSVGIVFTPLAHPFVDNATAKGVHHIALAANDPEAALAEAIEAGVDGDGSAIAAGVDGRRRIALPIAATAGVRTWFSEPLTIPPSESPFIERIDHLGVASSDNRLGRSAFVECLGYTYESEQVDAEFRQTMETFTSDKYGVVERGGTAELVGALRVTFINIGECDLEFLQDEKPVGSTDRHDGPLTVKQDKSAITRFVERRGMGLHHIALKTRDADATLRRLADRGAELIDTIGRPGSRRAQIGFIHPRTFGGLLVHLVERDEV